MDVGLLRRRDADRGVDEFCERCMPAEETVSPERYQQIVKRWADTDGELADLWAGEWLRTPNPRHARQTCLKSRTRWNSNWAMISRLKLATSRAGNGAASNPDLNQATPFIYRAVGMVDRTRTIRFGSFCK
jgi:hypothetical protein